MRAAAIERLAGDEAEDALDYIISVDIFSEGVDVPEINQVIMLRPTESPASRSMAAALTVSESLPLNKIGRAHV